MKQQLLDFREEKRSEPNIPFEQRVRRELVALMAAAIVAVHNEERVRTDESSSKRKQDNA